MKRRVLEEPCLAHVRLARFWPATLTETFNEIGAPPPKQLRTGAQAITGIGGVF